MQPTVREADRLPMADCLSASKLAQDTPSQSALDMDRCARPASVPMPCSPPTPPAMPTSVAPSAPSAALASAGRLPSRTCRTVIGAVSRKPAEAPTEVIRTRCESRACITSPSRSRLSKSPASCTRKHKAKHSSASGKEALVVFALDAADVLEAAVKDSARESSVARCYGALGAELHRLDDSESETPSPANALRVSRTGSHGPKGNRRSSSSVTSRVPGAASARGLSAMEMDVGASAVACGRPAPCAPSPMSRRSVSMSTLRVSKSRMGHSTSLLPPICPTKSSAGSLPGIATAQRRTSSATEPFAWSVDGPRMKLGGIGSVF